MIMLLHIRKLNRKYLILLSIYKGIIEFFMKKYFFIVCSLFLLSRTIVMANELLNEENLSIKLSNGTQENSFVISIKNISSFEVKIPYIYLNFFTKKNLVVSDWITVKHKNGKELSHKSIMIKCPSKFEDKDCLLLLPEQSYEVLIEDITDYYKKPLFNKNVEIYYRGPLGKSNILEIELE